MNPVWKLELRFIFFTLLISFAFTRHRKQVYYNILACQNSLGYFFWYLHYKYERKPYEKSPVFSSLSLPPNPPPTVLKHDLSNGQPESQFLTTMVTDSCSGEVESSIPFLNACLDLIAL